ncbi:chromosome segregation protein SMC [Shewanella sp. HL-SH2]|uniref:chromosome segregation protein SMC n=1 Tax=Shewanella sp. HL-SH2 TaxID=3436238 RepID=UPI003EBA5524
MRLKQIKLAGFKSFVDPTKIPFDHPLTAIIGPNGCGKSNVIDAVRWVLGESSAKNLRGDSMTDVIFNGSTSRKPISVAGVELIFENIQGRLAGQYASYQEISVKRQVNRDSESFYFLNGQKCRRKDITDLFMGTGLGPRSYAIIEQGTISRLIESKPQELRVFIEEAAGISRYKERRRETENRIRHTRENLERLNDIRQELGNQIERLAQQAQEAKQYRALKSQERELHTNLLAGRYQDLSKQSAEMHSQLNELERQQSEFAASQQSSENLVLQLQQQINGLTDTEQKLVEQYYQAGNEVAKFEQQLKHQQLQDSQREQEMLVIQQRLDDAVLKQQQYELVLAAGLNKQSALMPELEEAKIQFEMLDEQVHQVDESSDDLRHQFNDAANALNQVKTELAVYQSRNEHQQQLLNKHEQTIPLLQQKLQQLTHADIEQDILEQQAKLSRLNEQTIAEQAAKQQLDLHLVEAEQHLLQAQNGYHLIKDSLASTKARLQLINEWLDNQVGDVDVQQLWQVINVTPGYEKAVDVLLQSVSKAAVLTTENALTHLDSISNGFMLLSDTFSHMALTSPVNLAPWLEQVVFAETLVEAKEKIASLSASSVVVSKEGYLVGHGFILAQSNHQSVISLVTEQQCLIESVAELEAQSATALQLQTTQVTQLAQVNVLLGQSQQMLQQLLVAQTQAQSKYEGLVEQQHNHQITLQQLVQELHLAKEHQQQQLIEAEALSMQVETLETQTHQRQLRLEHAQHRFEHTSTQLRDLKTQRAELERNKANINQTLQQINTQVAVSRQQLTQQGEKISELSERYETIEQRSQVKQASLEQVERDNIKLQLEQQLDIQHRNQIKLNDNRQQQADLQQSLDASLMMQKQQLVTLQSLTQKISALKLRREGIKGQADVQLQVLQEEHINLQNALANIDDDFDIKACSKALETVRDEINGLGAINLAAIEEYDTQSERKQYLDSQDSDLNQGLMTLEDAIRKIDKETRTRFKATFDSVNNGLMQLFPKVFGGGKAYLALTDDDLLETGVTIMAQPPGKKNSTIHLLSGGEKALTALSLVFAIFRLNPAPFCMLDEVDAPLDDANVERFCRLLQEMSQSVQFVYISHNKITMEMADQLIGVTMHEPGVSRIVAVDIEAAVALADAI